MMNLVMRASGRLVRLASRGARWLWPHVSYSRPLHRDRWLLAWAVLTGVGVVLGVARHRDWADGLSGAAFFYVVLSRAHRRPIQAIGDAFVRGYRGRPAEATPPPAPPDGQSADPTS
jgi:hypothetical protein